MTDQQMAKAKLAGAPLASAFNYEVQFYQKINIFGTHLVVDSIIFGVGLLIKHR